MLIAVTGKKGQIVSALLERGLQGGVDIVALGRPELDLAEGETIHATLTKLKPDVVVSAAAYTAVDRAETEPALAFSLNADGPRIIAQVANELGVPIVHLSTDYVFAGDKDGLYVETDGTGPVSTYGLSKLAGEKGVAVANPNHAILRTAWIYSPFGANFLRTMLRLAESRDEVRVVADQFGSPTSALDVADAIISISKRICEDSDPKLRGVFHLTGSGEATWADFAEVIFAELEQKAGKVVKVDRITTLDYPTPAKRPANARLSNDKLREAFGIVLPDWRLSTKVVLDRLI